MAGKSTPKLLQPLTHAADAHPQGATAAAPDFAVEQIMAQAWRAWSEGDTKTASTLVSKLVKRAPAHEHGWFLLGLCAARQGKHSQALKHWENVQHSPDLLPHLAQAKGASMLSLGQPENAAHWLAQALEFAPEQAQLHFLLGLALKQMNDTESAQRSLRRAVLLEPTLAQAQFELGSLLLALGEPSRALPHLTAATELLPNAPEAFNNTGLCHQGLADQEKAEAAYRKAVALNPQYAEAWFNLGNLLGGNLTPEGTAAWEKALQIKPELREAMSHGA